MYIVAVIAILGVGAFLGMHFENAHEAHQHFISYRARTSANLSAWLKNTVVVGVSVVVIILLLNALLLHSR